MGIIKHDPFAEVKSERGQRYPAPQIVNDFHSRSDKDTSVTAQHHTLGNRPNQAAKGDHIHDGNNGEKTRTVVSTSSTSAQTTLTAETVVLSVSNEFKINRVYRVSYRFRVQMNGGTSPFVASVKARRSNASGTTIYDPGGTACITTNFMAIEGWFLVKRTGTSNTTQTVAITIDRSSTGTPTSIDVEASSTSPSLLVIEEVGDTTEYSGAIEIPTA